MGPLTQQPHHPTGSVFEGNSHYTREIWDQKQAEFLKAVKPIDQIFHAVINQLRSLGLEEKAIENIMKKLSKQYAAASNKAHADSFNGYPTLVGQFATVAFQGLATHASMTDRNNPRNAGYAFKMGALASQTATGFPKQVYDARRTVSEFETATQNRAFDSHKQGADQSSQKDQQLQDVQSKDEEARHRTAEGLTHS